MFLEFLPHPSLSVSVSQRIEWLPLDASGILYVTTPGWNTVVAQARREGLGNSKFAFVHYYVCMHAHSTDARVYECQPRASNTHRRRTYRCKLQRAWCHWRLHSRQYPLGLPASTQSCRHMSTAIETPASML